MVTSKKFYIPITKESGYTMKRSDLPQENESPAQSGFETFFKDDGKFYFQLVDPSGQPILFSKGYQSEKSRENGIRAVIKNAGSEAQVENKKSKKGQYYFLVKSSNHRVIGRSAMFDSAEIRQEKLDLVQQLDPSVPIFERAEAPQEGPTLREEQTAEKVGKRSISKEEAAAAATAREEAAEVMPRYKFTLIYYPDSGIWTAKNDFSGNTRQWKELDGAEIRDFLQTQVPAKEPSVKKAETPASPEKSVQTAPPVLQAAHREVNLQIFTQQGLIAKPIVESSKLVKIEVTPQSDQSEAPSTFNAMAMAKSMEAKRILTIGSVTRSKAEQGRLVIPIWEARNLSPGLYEFMVDIQEENTAQPVKYYGRQMVMID